MSRYIDADALIAELQKDEEHFDKEADDCRKNARNYTDCYMQAMSSRADGIRDAIVEVYDAPSIDIVRCKECKKLHDCRGDAWQTSVIEKGHIGWCNRTSRIGDVDYVKENDFCSYGEREGE